MDVRVERLYFVMVCGLSDTACRVPTLLVWWFSGYGMLSPFNVNLVVGCCLFVVGEGNKMGVFALKNMGVVDFVVWIFFCNFVDCVWWVVCRG